MNAHSETGDLDHVRGRAQTHSLRGLGQACHTLLALHLARAAIGSVDKGGRRDDARQAVACRREGALQALGRGRGRACGDLGLCTEGGLISFIVLSTVLVIQY